MNFGKKNTQKIISGIVTLFVITLLILSGPAAAISLSMDSFLTTPTRGDLISTTATISLNSNDRMPFPNNAGIYVDSKLVCDFAVNATKTECSGVTVELTSSTTNYDYGYGYANGDNYGYGYQQGYSNGVFTYNIIFDTDKLSIGDNNIQIKVNAGGSAPEYSSGAPVLLTVEAAENQQQANEPTETVTNDTTEIVFDSGSSSVNKIIINSSIDDTKKIYLDMSYFLNDSSVNVSTGLTLEREGDVTNYTAVIPAGTVITGPTGWDGKLTLPTVTTVTTSLGSVSTAVEMGSNVSLTFSNAVKIILAGMTGKKALWANSTGSYAIALCTDANSTSSGSLTTGECYVDTGSDLIIWTFHFTSFAAYTPASTTAAATGGSGGNSYAQKKAVNASESVNVSSEEVASTDATARPGLLARITGAVIGALGTTGTTVAVIFVLVVIVALIMVSRRKPKAGKSESADAVENASEEVVEDKPAKKSKRSRKNRK